MSTLYEAHEHDQWIEKSEDDLNTISIDEISDLFQQADDFGIRDVHPSVGKLDIIAKRYDLIKKTSSGMIDFDVTEIPDELIIAGVESKIKRKQYQVS